jgi:electron transport complex protein RnfA
MTLLGLMLIGVVLVNHLVLANRAGRTAPADRMPWVVITALASTFVLTASVPLAHLARALPANAPASAWIGPILLLPIVVIVTQLAARGLGRAVPHIEVALRALKPLVATNAFVLGLGLLTLPALHGPREAILYPFATGGGFGLALVLFTAMSDRLDADAIPPALRGAPIAIVNAALMALACAGLAGLSPD